MIYDVLKEIKKPQMHQGVPSIRIPTRACKDKEGNEQIPIPRLIREEERKVILRTIWRHW